MKAEKKEKRFICIQRQLILSYGSNENVPCLEMDIISILQVCSAWSYNFLRFQSHFPQNSLCCRSPPSTWFPPFLILLFCLIPQFFTFPIFFLQVFLFLILLFAKTLLVSDLLFNRPLTVLASPIPFHCLIMRRKNWDEISKRHVSVWKWRNYIEIVRAFSDINIGLPSFAIRCKVESRKTGLPEDPMYLEIHPCPKPLSVITYHVVVMTVNQSQELTFLCYSLICLKQWHPRSWVGPCRSLSKFQSKSPILAKF